MKPVGNYAYSIDFSDGHDTGIFTLESLREPGRASRLAVTSYRALSRLPHSRRRKSARCESTLTRNLACLLLPPPESPASPGIPVPAWRRGRTWSRGLAFRLLFLLLDDFVAADANLLEHIVVHDEVPIAEPQIQILDGLLALL